MGQELLTLSVASLRAAYPNANLPAETVAIYAAALEDLDPLDVQEATIALIRSSVYPPTIAEIRQKVAEARLQLPGPVAAWDEAVRRADGRWDRDANPLVTEAMQAIGGSWAIRTSENVIATRAQFLKFYGELRAARVGEFVQTGRLELEAA
jgi:hypothetical protein